MVLGIKDTRTMRDHFERVTGIDPDDAGIEWFVDEETPTTYSWVFLLKDKKAKLTLDKQSKKISFEGVVEK